MRRALLPFMLLTVACGSSPAAPDTSSTTPTSVSSPMSAVIAGSAWNSLPQVGVTYIPSGNFLSVNGTDTSGTPNSSTRTIGITVSSIPGPGTYSINQGNQAQVTQGNQTWQAGGNSGGSGTIVVTSLSTHRVAGTFSFGANAVAGTGATGTKSVTNGVFDVSY
jgi:hypothetical protein